jgi:hypothetical protein
VLNILVVNAEQRFQAPWWKLDLLQLTKLSPDSDVIWIEGIDAKNSLA